MRNKAPHTSFKQGIRVFVRLRDGTTFIDKFIQKKGRRVHFSNRTVATNQIRFASIANPSSLTGV